MKRLLLTLFLFTVNLNYSQWTDTTGMRISNATNSNPSPGIKYIGSSNDDGFTYNSLFLNNYGLGFYYKTHGIIYDQGINTYFSSYFGLDFFTNEEHRMRISRNGFIGIGTENPTSKLEINSGIQGQSGLKFTFLNSSSNSTIGSDIAPLGIDIDGNIVKTQTNIPQSIIYLSSYQDIESAIDFLNNSTTIHTLIIDKSTTLHNSKIINLDKSIRFLKGNVITIPNSIILTINGSIDSGIYQIFNCESSGLTNGSPLIREAYPQWWQENLYPEADWTNSVQKAINFYPKVFFPSNNYTINSSILLNLENSGYTLQGVGAQSSFTSSIDDYIFKSDSVPTSGGFNRILTIENMSFICKKAINISGGDNGNEFSNENASILNVNINKCKFANYNFNGAPGSNAIAFKKVFNSRITNNYIEGYEIGIKLEGSDINTIKDNRIIDFYRYAIVDLAFKTWGSQNLISHNDLLSYLGNANKGAFIKSTSAHIIIRDNYLENTRNKLFAYIDCSKFDLNSNEIDNAAFTKIIDITGNRCDAQDNNSTNHIYYITEKFKSLNLIEVPNLSSYNNGSTFGKDTNLSDPINYIKPKVDGINNWDKIINMVNCDSFKQWMTFSTTRNFSNSENGTLIISPKNIPHITYDPFNLVEFNPKSIKLKGNGQPVFLKIDQNLTGDTGELNGLPKKIKINIITRNTSTTTTSNDDYYIAIVNSPSLPNVWGGYGSYLTNNTTAKNFVKYTVTPDPGIVLDPTKNWYLVIVPNNDKEIRSIEIVDITTDDEPDNKMVKNNEPDEKEPDIKTETVKTLIVKVDNSLKFFPNPVKSNLTIDIKKNNIIKSIEIFSENGVFIGDYTNKITNNTIDISALPNASYVVKVVTISNSSETIIKE